MNTINERFNILIESLNRNPNNFAKSIGKTFTAIDSICKGKSKPGYELLEAVFTNYPNVSRDWLLMGEGEIFRNASGKSKDGGAFGEQVLNDVAKGLNDLKGTFEQELREKNQQIANLQEMLKMALGKFEGNNVRPMYPATNEVSAIAS